MILPGVQLNEIDHEPEPHAISQVAKDAGEQQRTSAQHAVIVSRRPKEIEQHSERGGAGKHDKKPTAKGAAFLQLAESDSRIFSIGKIDYASNDRQVLESKTSDRPGFAGLVHQVNTQGSDKIKQAPGDTCFVSGVHPFAALPQKQCGKPLAFRQG